ncbi:xyloglucan O-acetyltransferase 1 [Malania oleifera]|uniref:xyloglucan O-acetyltransferase 1 n=1 Tax=Malania oleifera TaxID=397392 RepID=UPI0025AE1D3A|nr:xyloglucan O-acetyltransferase 1 [Malania oleifera]
MGTAVSPFIDQQYSLPKKLIPCALYALLPLALLRLYFYPLPLLQSPISDHTKLTYPNPQNSNSITLPPAGGVAGATSPAIASVTTQPPPPPPPPSPPPPPAASSSSAQIEKEGARSEIRQCDLTNGRWVPDKSGPLYSARRCRTIKDGQNCAAHGRPDRGYLNWRWKPKNCNLSRFQPKAFLRLLRNKHLAFVGDSLARNQLESLLCMLATVSAPKLVYRREDNKFRRWFFRSFNATVSIYWSPFLVKGIEKTTAADYNTLYLDSIDERWASDLDRIDAVVLSIGHWFLHPAVYLEGDSVLGCHYCLGMNHTEIGFYGVFRKALKTTLKAIIENQRRRARGHGGIDVTVTTFSPAHFEGDWDKAGACPKKQPFKEGEKILEGMDAEMRKVEVEEVEEARKLGSGLRVTALDVTKLALMRPDGHPGPYMNPYPFVNGVTDRVQNDCVHWCLPGPIDTWNEILLEMMRRRQEQTRRRD